MAHPTPKLTIPIQATLETQFYFNIFYCRLYPGVVGLAAVLGRGAHQRAARVALAGILARLGRAHQSARVVVVVIVLAGLHRHRGVSRDVRDALHRQPRPVHQLRTAKEVGLWSKILNLTLVLVIPQPATKAVSLRKSRSRSGRQAGHSFFCTIWTHQCTALSFAGRA